MGRTKLGFLQIEYLYRLISLLSPLLFLLLWEGLVRLGWLDYRFFPPPSTVLWLPSFWQ